MSRTTLICRIVLLLALAAALPGCASSDHPPDYSDSTQSLAPVQSHEDDSHGWGAAVGNAQ